MRSETPAPNAASLTRSGALLALGLAVEAFTLFSTGPVSFLLFAGPGTSLILLGIADYLFRVLRAGSRET
jgi:hypothetical protein